MVELVIGALFGAGALLGLHRLGLWLDTERGA
jgi:hypothetical protein